MRMDKKAKTREIGIIGYFLACIIIIIFGLILLQDDNATDPNAIQIVDNIGSISFLVGILGIILGIIIVVSFLLKKLKEYT